MSYSSQLKTKLANTGFNEQSETEAELYGFLTCASSLVLMGRGEIRVVFDFSASAVARRVYSLIKEIFGFKTIISVTETEGFAKTKLYKLSTASHEQSFELLRYFELMDSTGSICAPNAENSPFLKTEENIRAFFKGVFLARGFIDDPVKSYYMQFTFTSPSQSEDFCTIIRRYGIFPKTRTKKNDIIIYVKKAQEVTELAALCGAAEACFAINDTLILKQMKNNAMRIVNCNTANADKTADSSARQTAAIDKITAAGLLSSLPETLISAAQLRLDNPGVSLKELCELTDPPIKKSTLNNRLNRLCALAETINEKEVK